MIAINYVLNHSFSIIFAVSNAFFQAMSSHKVFLYFRLVCNKKILLVK